MPNPKVAHPAMKNNPPIGVDGPSMTVGIGMNSLMASKYKEPENKRIPIMKKDAVFFLYDWGIGLTKAANSAKV